MSKEGDWNKKFWNDFHPYYQKEYQNKIALFTIFSPIVMQSPAWLQSYVVLTKLKKAPARGRFTLETPMK